jgi:hypothetical protein
MALFARGVPLDAVENALVLAASRRVTFQSAADRLLYAPPQLPQDAPDVSGVIVDFEVLFNQVGHSLARP